MKTIYLIRHGESEGNSKRIFQGWLDCALTSEGRFQAELLAERLKNKGIRYFFSSPLKRAYETAEIIAKKYDEMNIIKIEKLKELNCGKWQGLTREEVKKISPKQLHNFLYNPEKLQIPGGDSIVDLQKRAIKALFEILNYVEDDNVLCIVAHGFINKVILCTILNLPLSKVWDFPQANTGVNIIKYDGKFDVIEINNTDHLMAEPFKNKIKGI